LLVPYGIPGSELGLPETLFSELCTGSRPTNLKGLEKITMRTATPDRRKITDTPFAKGFGEYDLWELWLLDEAEDVPCGSILTFLHYLCSEGTKHCEILDASTLATGFVDIRLTGPRADDERNHLLHYRLTRGNAGRLEEAERDLLASTLIQHYPTKEGESHQKMRQALTAVGLSLA
jgi:hypothetical protein